MICAVRVRSLAGRRSGDGTHRVDSDSNRLAPACEPGRTWGLGLGAECVRRGEMATVSLKPRTTADKTSRTVAQARVARPSLAKLGREAGLPEMLLLENCRLGSGACQCGAASSARSETSISHTRNLDASASSTLTPKARKERHFFRSSDDMRLLQALLDDRESVFSPNCGERAVAWKVVPTTLNRQGILVSTHSLRCRLKRLLDKFYVGIRQGNQPADFTELERLLDQYTQAEAQYKQQKAGTSHRAQPLQETPCHPAPNFSDSQSDDGDSVATEPAQHRSLPLLVELVSSPAPSASVQSTPERGRKPRKRRFFFQDWHDRLLLNALLADQGFRMASRARKPYWKSITASLTSHGLDVNTHTRRTHLQLIVDTYRKEASSWDTYPGQFPEKQRLLRDYCRKLDNQETDDHDDQSVEPGIEDQDSQVHDDRAATNRLEIGGRVVESARSSQNHATDLVSAVAVVGIYQERDFNNTSTQTSEAASSSIPVAQTPSTAATSSSSDTPMESVQTAEGFSTPIATRDRSAAQPPPDNETGGDTEPAWKRQKLELETILQRFVSEQSERQREERKQERARFSEQQDLQRQTIELQKRALDMQEKAMSMQDRLMSLMEQVMDKLN